MPIVAKESSKKVNLNKEQLFELEYHAKHSSFHMSILHFYNKNGFLTEKQVKYTNFCNLCNLPEHDPEYDFWTEYD